MDWMEMSPSGNFGLERADCALLARTGFERVEVVELHGVEVGDLVNLIIGNTNKRMGQQIRRVWPGAVGVGVIPQRHDCHRDDAIWVRTGPPIDMPVVVGTNADQGKFFVVGTEGQLAAEVHEGGKLIEPSTPLAFMSRMRS